MGITERKEREREEMRRRILDAAKALFLEQGFDKTSIRNIADYIEYSPGTIYLYFKDKNELLLALHTEAFELFGKHLSRNVHELTPIDRLAQMGKNYIQYALQNPELYELMFMMRGPIDSLVCQREPWTEGLQSFETLRDVVRDCHKEGYLSAYQVDHATLLIWSFVHGLVSLHTRNRLMMFQDTPEQLETRIMETLHAFNQLIRQK